MTFYKAHERAYGHAFYDRPIEMVNLRLQAAGMVEKPVFTPEAVQENDESSARIGHKNGMMLYQREQFIPGAQFAGAALIFQLDSTVYVPEGWSARVDGYRNIILMADGS